jgi:hypothetical protein
MEAIKLSLYVTNQATVATELSEAFVLLWNNGLFNAVTLPIRMIYEIWGSVHYAHNIFKGMNDNFEVTQSKTTRLITGSRSNIELPWGGTSNITSVHILDFIRSLNDICPEAEENYNYLCEACHPNFIRHAELQIMGPKINNWDNKNFQKNAHKLVNQTLFIMETALIGLTLDINESLELALCYMIDNPNVKH